MADLIQRQSLLRKELTQQKGGGRVNEEPSSKK